MEPSDQIQPKDKGKLLEMLYGDLEYFRTQVNSLYGPDLSLAVQLTKELESLIDGVINGEIFLFQQIDGRISKIAPKHTSYKKLLVAK